MELDVKVGEDIGGDRKKAINQTKFGVSRETAAARAYGVHVTKSSELQNLKKLPKKHQTKHKVSGRDKQRESSSPLGRTQEGIEKKQLTKQSLVSLERPLRLGLTECM